MAPRMAGRTRAGRTGARSAGGLVAGWLAGGWRGTGTEPVRARATSPAPATRTARLAPTALSTVSWGGSPSRPTPTARLAVGLTTVITGSETIGKPAWWAVWVSSSEHAPPMATA